jgi:hypothetical protein
MIIKLEKQLDAARQRLKDATIRRAQIAAIDPLSPEIDGLDIEAGEARIEARGLQSELDGLVAQAEEAAAAEAQKAAQEEAAAIEARKAAQAAAAAKVQEAEVAEAQAQTVDTVRAETNAATEIILSGLEEKRRTGEGAAQQEKQQLTEQEKEKLHFSATDLFPFAESATYSQNPQQRVEATAMSGSRLEEVERLAETDMAAAVHYYASGSQSQNSGSVEEKGPNPQITVFKKRDAAETEMSAAEIAAAERAYRKRFGSVAEIEAEIDSVSEARANAARDYLNATNNNAPEATLDNIQRRIVHLDNELLRLEGFLKQAQQDAEEKARAAEPTVAELEEQLAAVGRKLRVAEDNDASDAEIDKIEREIKALKAKLRKARERERKASSRSKGADSPRGQNAPPKEHGQSAGDREGAKNIAPEQSPKRVEDYRALEAALAEAAEDLAYAKDNGADEATILALWTEVQRRQNALDAAAKGARQAANPSGAQNAEREKRGPVRNKVVLPAPIIDFDIEEESVDEKKRHPRKRVTAGLRLFWFIVGAASGAAGMLAFFWINYLYF